MSAAKTETMSFELSCDLNDGFANAPPLTVEVRSIDDLLDQMMRLDTFTNDYGVPIPAGAVVTVRRIV